MRITEHDVTAILKAYGRGTQAKDMLYSAFKDPQNIEVFAWFCFGDSYLTKPSPPFHYDMLDEALKPGFLGIGAPRGFAKSTVFNLKFVAWNIATETRHFIVIISDTYTQAVDHVESVQDAIGESANFKWLYGDLKTRRWGRDDFVTSNGVRVVAKGSGMKIRGLKFKQYRPELIIGDDLENDELVASADRRKKLKNWLLRSVLPALAPNGKIIIIGTILHHDSLLNNVLKKREEFASWNTMLFKAITMVKGKPQSLWPEHLSLGILERMRDDPTFKADETLGHPGYKGSIVFAQEYQNEPFSDEDAVIQEGWIKWIKDLPPAHELVRRAFTVDPAISKKETADFTGKIAGALGKDGNIYVYRIGNDRFSFREGLKDINKWNRQEEPSVIGIETVAFQKALSDSLPGLPIVEIARDADKIRRTIAVSRYFEAGNVIIVEGIRHAATLKEQLLEFPFGSHDDLVDALVDLITILLGGGIGSYGKIADELDDTDEDAKPITSGLMDRDF